MNLFQKTLRRENTSGQPPIWFMRQAGRYHAHYQNLRKTHGFLDLCRIPDVCAETAMGPVEDFGFDAAILFSDILFPIAAMGIALDFNPGPQLGHLLESPADLSHYKPVADAYGYFRFQSEALSHLKKRLPKEKGLIGFVGGPLTIYQFAVKGSGKTDGEVEGLTDGRFEGFMERLLPLLLANMQVQADAGIDVMAVLDTSAGKLPPDLYYSLYLPYLTRLICSFKASRPGTNLLYYSKGTNAEYWRMLGGLPIEGLGIDYTNNLAAALREFGARYAIQGNIDPEWMRLPWPQLKPKLETVFAEVKALPPELRKGWICGLGHGILPDVPEENVRQFLALARGIFPTTVA